MYNAKQVPILYIKTIKQTDENFINYLILLIFNL
jgi:hypothetical protein